MLRIVVEWYQLRADQNNTLTSLLPFHSTIFLGYFVEWNEKAPELHPLSQYCIILIIYTMFDYSYFYDIFKTEEGDIRKPNLHSVHFGRFAAYNKKWKINDIIIYEAMLYLHRRFGGKPFTMNNKYLVEMTRFSKNIITSKIKELEKKGYLSVKKRKGKIGTDFRNLYSINFSKIITSFDEIYEFDETKPDEVITNKEILEEWYLYLKNNPYSLIAKKTD